MDENGHDASAQGIAAALLARTYGALDHRVHHFEMRRIERQRHVYIAARVRKSAEKPL